MDWLLLTVLVIVWAIVLLPRKPRPARSRLKEELLAMASLHEGDRRRVLMPPRRASVKGPAGARDRLRRRRRRVLSLMLEALALTALIGAFPPLRAMWWATGLIAALLAAYVALLLRAKRSRPVPQAPVASARLARRPTEREETPGVVVIPLVSGGRRTGTGG